MKKYFFLFTYIFYLFFPLVSYASVFDIHFLYDSKNNRLVLDPNVSNPIFLNKEKDPSVMEFLQKESSGDFEISILYGDGYEVVRKKFLPVDGKFVFQVPYFSLATTLNVFKGVEIEPIISYDLSSFVSCYKNNICEYERGETIDTCLPDCVGKTTKFSSETQKALMASGGIIKDPKTGEVILRGTTATVDVDTPTTPAQSEVSRGLNVVMLAIGVGVFFFVVIGAFIIYRLKQRNKRYGL